MTDEKYRLDDLQNKDLKIWQDTSEFCFGTDAVLLADFASAKIRKKDRYIDICTGNGIIPLLVYARTENKNMTAVEINETTAELASYNMAYNGLNEYINVVCADVKSYARENLNKFDVITVNPPYIPVGTGMTSKKDSVSAARHEVFLSLEELIHSCTMLLKDKGKVFMVHRAHRAAETIAAMSRHRITPKSIRFIYPKNGEEANLFLVEGVKNTGDWLKVLPPLVVYNDDGSFTEEIYEIYGRGNEND